MSDFEFGLVVSGIAIAVAVVLYFAIGIAFDPSEPVRLTIVGFVLAVGGSFGGQIIAYDLLYPWWRYWSSNVTIFACVLIVAGGTALAWALSTESELDNAIIMTATYVATLAISWITRLAGGDLS